MRRCEGARLAKLKRKEKFSKNSEPSSSGATGEMQPNEELDKELDEVLSEELKADKKKASKGAVATLGLISVVFGLIVIIFSLFQSFDTSAVINPVKDKNIHVEVTIVSSQFKQASSSAACSGSGNLAGISNSNLVVAQSSSGMNEIIALGHGSLTQDGSCLYAVVVKPPDNFTGGKVSGSVKFPFGNAPITSFDIGNQPPFAKFAITINLS
jgi:hypothetical protein